MPEPEAKPRRLRVKKPGEAGAAEEPCAPAQGKRRPPTGPMEMGDTLVPPTAPSCTSSALHRRHLLKCAGVKKLRKKKEEKGEEESNKDPYSKFTREPRKKKESPAPRSRVAKGPKKQQGGGAAPTPLRAPACGTSCPRVPRPHAPCPTSAIDAPGICRGSACPWGAFWPKPSYTPRRKGDVAGDLYA